MAYSQKPPSFFALNYLIYTLFGASVICLLIAVDHYMDGMLKAQKETAYLQHELAKVRSTLEERKSNVNEANEILQRSEVLIKTAEEVKRMALERRPCSSAEVKAQIVPNPPPTSSSTPSGRKLLPYDNDAPLKWREGAVPSSSPASRTPMKWSEPPASSAQPAKRGLAEWDEKLSFRPLCLYYSYRYRSSAQFHWQGRFLRKMAYLSFKVLFTKPA